MERRFRDSSIWERKPTTNYKDKEIMKIKTEEWLKILGLPLTFLAIFLLFWAAWEIFNLPSENELIEITRRYFDLYGYLIVFVSAIIEGMLLAGLYYPGSLVIFLGVIFAGKNIPEVTWVVGLVTAGLLLAYSLNYMLGKYGWYKLLLRFGLRRPIEKVQTHLARYGLSIIFLSYWQPNLAALTSTAAGILQFPFRKFMLYSTVAAIAWNVFWGGVVYFLGEAALSAIGIRFVLVIVIIWIAYRLIFRRNYASNVDVEQNDLEQNNQA